MTTKTPEEAVIPEDDLIRLLRVSEGAVLIGGQALAFWVAYFGIEIPSGPRTYISADADFLGFSEHVKTFSKAIGGMPGYPGKREITALYGVVSKETKEGQRIGVDVLRTVLGLGPGVADRAVDVHHPNDTSLRFKVMDPIDCLVSRVENLRRLSEKQNDVGIWQGRIAIDVGRAYLESLIANDNERKAIKAATAVLKITGTAPGLQAFRKYGLDLLEAIPVDSFTSESFKKQQFTRTVQRIQVLRNSYAPPPPSKKAVAKA